ncbi:NAD(P)H-binding protein [Antrihabitans sp. YC3-6]|uniref:NAD(P)H-binding protein n=1 Tax=Antrihabitans stalagmiti TaxID=2799499 RepID=A0A934U623_9NOCA|nr:NAD(P)H-binding protein [Antrihabitans stalagmiti]MBJ8342061.1 NAD(P)H-binding protein [Antrihabitans stalagmiti]
MTILVTGATGSVGRHLITTLLARGADVRAVSRKPDDAALPAGVDVVAGDLADASTLGPEVFDGVDQAFVFPAQGVDTFVAAAVSAGVHRFTVLSSLAAALEFPRDHGSASQLHHSAVEAAVTERTDAWTILRPGTFANNLLSWAWQIRTGAPIRAPFLASAQAPIHEYDVAEAAAETLLSDDYLGEVIAMTGPQAVTRTQQVAAIGNALDRKIQLIEITPDEFRSETEQFIPEPVLKMLLDYWSDTLATPDQPRPVTPVTRRPGRSLEQWATDHRADFGA